MDLSLTSELDAVNAMLAIIGESPVDTLLDNGVADAAIAAQILRETHREVQSQGWQFNTDVGFQLAVEAAPYGSPTPLSGRVPVPPTALLVVSLDPAYPALSVRGGYLWDTQGLTDQFTQAVRVKIVRLLDFGDSPEPCRRYTMVKAGRVFQDRVVGSATLSGFTERDEQMAQAALARYEALTGNYNLKLEAGMWETVGRGRGWRGLL